MQAAAAPDSPSKLLTRWQQQPLRTPAASDLQINFSPVKITKIFICIRGNNGTCKLIVITITGLGVLVAGTALNVHNFHAWNNNLATVLTGVGMGTGLTAMGKFNFPHKFEKVLDEFFMFLAPIVFQAMAQAEINTPADSLWKDIWFTLIGAQLGATLLGHLTNVMSASAVQFGIQSEAMTMRPLLGDTRQFLSVLKFQIPLIISSVALVTLGIVNKDTLLLNLGAFLAGREVGLLLTQKLLDFAEKIRAEFNSKIKGDQAIPSSPVSEMVVVALKITPFALPFIFGGLAGWGDWIKFAGIGAVSGLARLVKARFFQRDFHMLTRSTRHESMLQRFCDALLPYRGYLFSARQRSEQKTKRVYIDIGTGTIASLTTVGINAWAAYWWTQFDDPFDRSQLIAAGWTANIGYLAACATPALCVPGANIIENTIFFQLSNLEDFFGPIYLAIFDEYIKNQDSLESAIPMWILWSILLIMPLIMKSKNGQKKILSPASVYYMWSIWTAIKYSRGQLEG